MHTARLAKRFLVACFALALSGCPTGDPGATTEDGGNGAASGTSTGAPPMGGPPMGGPPMGGPGGGMMGAPDQGQSLSPAEDLSAAWSELLGVAVPPLADANPCPDADGDGFFAATLCPSADPSTLDCDDADPAVTPETERWVRPGPFVMGAVSDHAGADEDPVHIVTLSGYCLDTTEVGAGDFAAWLAATGRTPTSSDFRNHDDDGTLTEGRAKHPAEGVTHAEATDYCASVGKKLPTEAQWEKAARGGCELGSGPSRCDPEDLRSYPWGTGAPTCANSNHQLTTGGQRQLCKSDTVPVGGTPAGAGPYGHTELAGNVWEVVADWWHPTVYSADRARVDPAGPSDGTFHVLRGGGWSTYSTNMRAANRFTDALAGSGIGLRCARPTVASRFDDVEPLRGVTLRGKITRQDGGKVSGNSVHITVFDAADIDAGTGMMAAGRSPVIEARFDASGEAEQPFEVTVPAGAKYMVSASLDDGSGGSKQDFFPSSSSGGIGQCDQNPVEAGDDVDGLTITLRGRGAGGPGGPMGGPPMGGPPMGGPPMGGPPMGGPPMGAQPMGSQPPPGGGVR